MTRLQSHVKMAYMTGIYPCKQFISQYIGYTKYKQALGMKVERELSNSQTTEDYYSKALKT